MKALFSPVFALILLTGCTNPPSPPQAYLTDRMTGCKIRNPYIATGDDAPKVEWSGQCDHGLAEGRGTISYYDENGNRTAYLRTCIDSANYSCSGGSHIPN